MQVQDGGGELEKNKYVILKKVLSDEVCELLSDYAKLKARVKPNVYKRNDPLNGIHREYGDLMMETLLARFTPLVEQVTGLALWPTLSFYYTYQHGNQLKAHKDRSSCQIVAGLCIGADDEFKQSHATWPLICNMNGIAEPIALEAGDMVIFNGHDIEHWREPFMGTWFVSAIFGFVDKQGPYAFQKYDQRQSLGKSHVGMFRWLYGCLKHKKVLI